MGEGGGGGGGTRIRSIGARCIIAALAIPSAREYKLRIAANRYEEVLHPPGENRNDITRTCGVNVHRGMPLITLSPLARVIFSPPSWTIRGKNNNRFVAMHQYSQLS